MEPEATDVEPSSSVLDAAHEGDIRGAFGTIRQHDVEARRSWGLAC